MHCAHSIATAIANFLILTLVGVRVNVEIFTYMQRKASTRIHSNTFFFIVFSMRVASEISTILQQAPQMQSIVIGVVIATVCAYQYKIREIPICRASLQTFVSPFAFKKETDFWGVFLW